VEGWFPVNEQSTQFFKKIKSSKNLPSLPHILLKLINTCNREESTIKDLSQIINNDSSLCAKVMKMVNSSYHGLSPRVPNIDQALVLLGKDAIKNISVSLSVNNAFSHAEDKSLFELKVFWKHSLMCAIVAKMIAEKIVYTSPDEAFLSGLLHDIGKLVLLVNFPSEYGDILKTSKDQKDLVLLEEALHGATHCQVGAWLINRWNLQSFITDAVLYHHESVDRIFHALPLIKIIYTANILCPETIQEKAVKFGIAEHMFGLNRSEVDEIIHRAEREVRETAKSLDIDIEPLDVQSEAVSGKDYEKQEDLISEVKDISLLHGTLHNLLETQGEDSILQVVQQGLQILFDVKHVCFFLYDSERDVLVGRRVMSNKENDLINEVVIPFQQEKSILVKTLLQGNHIFAFNNSETDKYTIIDEQIIRLIGKDGIFCLPMVAQKQYVGVIALGIDEADVSHLSKQIRLLTMLTKHATLALQVNYLRQSQTELIQSERLTASSALARRVVHEVNTPLSIIKNYLLVIKRKLAEDTLVQDELAIINEEIDRVAHTLSGLSDFSEPDSQPTYPLDINDLLTDLTRIYQETLMLKSNIKAHLKLDASLPSINMDKNRLKQVFINLIQNAVEAMPDGGNIYISTRYASNESEATQKQITSSDRGHVEIIIRDDGPGIPDILTSQFFEPFITSKGAGHAGLGLSIVYNTLNELKGSITCTSDSNIGTSFNIILPIEKNQEPLVS
jgi:signal transduction histidine kinase/HD-like signal output (HDOD) protein